MHVRNYFWDQCTNDFIYIFKLFSNSYVFGGITSVIKKNFDLKIFITGFFGNAILSILLTILGQKLNVDIYLAAIVVFVGRMFTNLGIIRRYYVDKWSKRLKQRKEKQEETQA